MRMVRGLVLAGVAAVLLTGTASAADKTKDLIVGKWEGTHKIKVNDEEKEVKVTLEFTKDGKLTMTGGKRVNKATYKVIDDTTIEVTSKQGDEEKTNKIKIKLSKDELEVTPPKGDKVTLKRVKAKKG